MLGQKFCIAVHKQNVDNDFDRIIRLYKEVFIEGVQKELILNSWNIR